MRKQKLFNFDPVNGLPEPISIGGLPYFAEDIEALQANSTTFNLNAMLAGWSVIISGCEVDEVNVGTKQIKVLPGIVQLATDQGDIKYYFEGYEGTYPFSIIPGTIEPDDRRFFDNVMRNVGEDYNYATRTSFNVLNAEGYPTDLSYNEIYFDPFTDQRAEYVIQNMGKGKGEMIQSWITDNDLTTEYTETHRSIVGGSISSLTTSGNFYKGNYFSFLDWGRFNTIERVLVNGRAGELDRLTGGNEEVILQNRQIPRHDHELGDDGGTSTALGTAGIHAHSSGTYQTDTHDGHTHSIPAGGGSSGPRAEISVDTSGGGYNKTSGLGGAHSHDVQGSSGDAGNHTHSFLSGSKTGGGSISGLKDNPTPIDVRQPFVKVGAKIYAGYDEIFGTYNVRPSFYKGRFRRILY